MPTKCLRRALQFAVWGNTSEGRHILIAVARYLVAHSPTERAALQTADIARRLMRGGELHQEAGASVTTRSLFQRLLILDPSPRSATARE